MILRVKKIPFLVVLISIVATLLFIWFRKGGDGRDLTTEEARKAQREARKAQRKLLREQRSKYAGMAPREAVKVAVKGMKGKASVRRKRQVDDSFSNYEGMDREIATYLQEALDLEEGATVFDAARLALKSDNPELRSDGMEALSWYGADALDDLTPMMADPDEDVAEEACYYWGQALNEVESAEDRFSVATAVMATITDKNALDSIAGEFANAATEWIDGFEDPVQENEARVIVVQALVDIIHGDSEVNAEQAKDAYEDITGNRWVDIDEAEQYLQDPDNYEGPEDDDGE